MNHSYGDNLRGQPKPRPLWFVYLSASCGYRPGPVVNSGIRPSAIAGWIYFLRRDEPSNCDLD